MLHKRCVQNYFVYCYVYAGGSCNNNKHLHSCMSHELYEFLLHRLAHLGSYNILRKWFYSGLEEVAEPQDCNFTLRSGSSVIPFNVLLHFMQRTACCALRKSTTVCLCISLSRYQVQTYSELQIYGRGCKIRFMQYIFASENLLLQSITRMYCHAELFLVLLYTSFKHYYKLLALLDNLLLMDGVAGKQPSTLNRLPAKGYFTLESKSPQVYSSCTGLPTFLELHPRNPR